VELHLSAAQLLAAAAVVLGAAAVKGALGLGFPVITVPVLSALAEPHAGVVLSALPTLASNVFILGAERKKLEARWAEMRWVLGGLIVGSALGARAFQVLNAKVLNTLLGVLAVGYALPGLLRVTWLRLPRASAAQGLSVGLVAGVLCGTTTIFGPVLAGYLDARGLGRDEFVPWITLAFLVGVLVQVLTFFQVGVYRGGALRAALWLCVPAVAGTALGGWLRRRMPEEGFRTALLGVVLISGVNLLARGLL
jgi:uncharacterized membrane protein YfcA